MKLFVLDIETSDLDPTRGANILEIAWVELTRASEAVAWEQTFQVEQRIQFTGNISPHAQAVHHITKEELTAERGAVTRSDAIKMLQGCIEPDSYLVAHNAEFDSKFLPELHNPWICTMRSARHLWPNAPGYGNQVLRYWLKLEIDIPNRFPHQALYDTITTKQILLKLLELKTPAELMWYSSAPVKLKTLRYGKHKGIPIEQVPVDYITWLSSKQDLDMDTRYTLDSIMKMR